MAKNLTREWLSSRRNLYSFVFTFHVCQYVYITTVMSYGAKYLHYLGETQVSYSNQIMLGGMVLCGCFSSIVFGRLVDLTGSLKEITVGTLVVIIASTVLYVIGPEPVLVGIAYGLFGLSDGISVVLRSELCKVYDKSKITTVQLVVRFGSVVGTALGCLLVLGGIFAKIEVGAWQVSGANFGVVIAGVEFCVLLLMSFVGLSNVSKMYNFKINHEEKEFRMKLDAETSMPGLFEHDELLSEENYFRSSKEKAKAIRFSSLRLELALLLRCLPTFKILIMSFLHGCISLSFERFLPLIGDEIVSWQGLSMSIAYFFSCIPPLFAILFYWGKGRFLSDYKLLFGGYWFIAICGLMSGVLGIFISKKYYGILLFTFTLPAHKLSWGFQDAITASMMSKHVPSQSQCISEAIRYMITSCGMCIGAFLTGVAYSNLIIYSGLMVTICCFSFFLLWSERDTYSEPKLLWVVNSGNEEFTEFDT